MLTSITSSQFAERLLYGMLTDGHYRKFLTRLRERLDEARANVIRAFERIGLQLLGRTRGGNVRVGAVCGHRQFIGAGGTGAARRVHAGAGQRISSSS